MNDDSQPIRAFIISDQLVIRRGLEAIIRLIDGFVMVGEASSAAEAGGLIETLQPHVILMDIVPSDPDQASVDEMALLRQQFPDLRIVVLSANAETSLISAIINAGANSWVLPGITLASLAAALRSTIRGQTVLAPQVAAKLTDTASRPKTITVSLTSRESEVLKLMGQGLANQEIAAQLVISHATVKYHVTNILRKVGATHRSQAIIMAIQQGLIDKKKR